MSERAARRLLGKAAQEEDALLQEAIDRIHASRGLRFLLARFFDECGMAQSPFSPDPLTMARNCGMLEAAHALRDTIEHIDPQLYEALTAEMKEYERDRTDKLDRISNGGSDPYA